MKAIKIIKNRYFYSALSLLIILFIIEDTTIFKLYRMKKELHEIKKENIKKEIEIKQIKEKTIQLTTNREALEKFAREQYLMKKKDEVIYVFDDL